MYGSVLGWLIDTVLGLYWWLLIIYAVMSWLNAFGVINNSNRFVYTVGDFLSRLIEPALRPIRRIVPAFNGVDLSFLVLIIGIQFLRMVLARYVYPFLP
ncbi:YggT family protein [Lacibacterium aquatile]|uniref:YggT family protein n=1 Tax=Lacibacterium aquatile TaxID=1168082 RepID=A0ABW5DMZ3_9PROT